MRFYRLLLCLYPASFRNEYADEMLHLFMLRRSVATGPVAVGWLWLAAPFEVTFNAVLVHRDLLRQDLHYTVRILRRAPAFAITAMLLVALGIGATTAAFSVADFVLLRPLPFADPDRLVKIWESTPGYSRMELSPANLRDWRQGSTSFSGLGACYTRAVNFLGGGEPSRVEHAAVSGNLFATLGVQPLLGRSFTEADDRPGAPGTVILGYALWQTEFGGRADAIGRQVVLDNQPYTILGVMPRDFRFPSSEEALWTTMRLPEDAYQDRNDNWLEAVGRLRDGVTIDQARAEWQVLAARSRQQYPRENAHTSVTILSLASDVSKNSRVMLLALCGAALCVLLIGCANLANLLLARALGRRRELAVRAAMGAGRERLVRQLITEGLLLALVGGAAGVLVAALAVPLLSTLVPSALPIPASPSVDLRVLIFSTGVIGLTGVSVGLIPALRIGRDVDAAGLREGSRGGTGRKERMRSVLVVAQIAASIVLLVSTGLLLRALRSVQGVDPGFRPAGVLTLETALPVAEYGAVEKRQAFYNRVLSSVRAQPGVAHAAYVSFLPLEFGGGIWPVTLPGQPAAATRADNQVASLRYATPDFFATMGIPLKVGRDFAESDTRDQPFVAVVSESFATRYWPNENPLGRHFQFAFADRMVVGVVGDIHVRGLERPSEPQVYVSYLQVDDGAIIGYIPKNLVIRAATMPAVLVPAIRRIIHAVNPQQPIAKVRTLSEIVEKQTAPRSLQLGVIAAFAAVALLLAAIGIHGLLAFSVSQRSQEIGIRLALGARARDVVRMVAGRSLLLAMAGIAPGLALAYSAGRAMQGVLFGVMPGDTGTYLGVAGIVIAMTIAGTVFPTRRALSVDPMSAVRMGE